MRWIYHVRIPSPDAVEPSSEGFIHCSYQPAVLESARLYFPAGAELEIVQIDPRGLAIEVADTPRGPMPHVHQTIAKEMIVRRWRVEEFSNAPDQI